MPTFEYRKLIRANILLKVVYKTLREPILGGTVFSKNISATGANIVTTNRLVKGTELELQVYLSDSDAPISARGKVIWQQKCSYLPESRVEYLSTGVQFSYMSSQDAIKASDFVKDVVKSQSETENRRIIDLLEDLRSKGIST